MSIDREVVKKIAKLSRLKLTVAETETTAKELSEVLVFVKKLEKINTSSVSPMTTVTPMESKDRSDEILRNAPSVKEGFFSVPKVIE